jgi:hypothetical protein
MCLSSSVQHVCPCSAAGSGTGVTLLMRSAHTSPVQSTRHLDLQAAAAGVRDSDGDTLRHSELGSPSSGSHTRRRSHSDSDRLTTGAPLSIAVPASSTGAPQAHLGVGGDSDGGVWSTHVDYDVVVLAPPRSPVPSRSSHSSGTREARLLASAGVPSINLEPLAAPHALPASLGQEASTHALHTSASTASFPPRVTPSFPRSRSASLATTSDGAAPSVGYGLEGDDGAPDSYQLRHSLSLGAGGTVLEGGQARKPSWSAAISLRSSFTGGGAMGGGAPDPAMGDQGFFEEFRLPRSRPASKYVLLCSFVSPCSHCTVHTESVLTCICSL